MPANVGDREALILSISLLQDKINESKKIYADMGYQAQKLTKYLSDLGLEFVVVERPRKWTVGWAEGVEPPEMHKFTILPKRWVVERTFAWLGKFRRLSRDYVCDSYR